MKIEEAKEAIKASSKAMTDINVIHSFGHIPCKQAIPVNDVINIITQIEPDQPKPVVPQMIFDVIESFDDDVDYLHEHMGCQSDEVREWLTHNERDFYEAWLAYPNITVEKEKLYTVEIPNPNGNLFQRVALCRGVLDNEVFINYTNDPNWKSRDKFQLTEAEIRKDFDWAFRFAKEVTE